MRNLDNKKFICTGCFLCSNICPTDAIKMIQDQEGFYQYQIIEEKCISCEKCVKSCPKIQNIDKEKDILNAYAAYTKDDEVLKQSSSGGIFSELAKEIFNQKGVVVGATWQKGEVKHILISKEKDLEKLQSSKYLQSNLNQIFNETKKALDKNKIVLFSGTSCQIAALNNFIKHDNLYTVDIVCHGVPSQKVFNLSQKQRLGKENVEVNFRSKANGWADFELEYKNEHSIFHKKDAWFSQYLDNHFLKKDCYDCPFISKERLADISLGDYWGIANVDAKFFKDNNNKGVSLVLINSRKGQKLFDNISDNLVYKETKAEEANKYNQRILSGKYDDEYLIKRANFFKKYHNNEIIFDDSKVIIKKTSIIRRVLGKIKRTIVRR